MKMRPPRRRGANTASLIDAWSMEGAEANTTELISAWSMEGALSNPDSSLGVPTDGSAIATAEHARVCGTAYDVPVLVKRPGDDDWVPLVAAASDADGAASASDVAKRLINY